MMTHARDKIVATPEQVKAISNDFALGASLRQLEETHRISRPVIKRILALEVSKLIVEETRGKATKAAVALLRSRMCDLVEQTVSVIEKALQNGDLKAVPLVFKVLGIEAETETKATQQQTIQVVLPQGVSPKEVPNVSHDLQEE